MNRFQSVSNGPLRKFLVALLRPGIGRDVSVAFAILGLIGVVAALYANHELRLQDERGRLILVTSRLGTLSQRIALTTQQAAQNHVPARLQLPRLQAQFEDDLRYVEQTGTAHGLFVNENSAKSLIRLKREWLQSRQTTAQLLAVPHGSPGMSQQLLLVNQHMDALLAAADDTVHSVFPHFAEQRENLRYMILAAVLLGLAVASGTYLYIRRRLLLPLKMIAVMSHRFANGDLDARIAYEASDEIGRLVKTINRTATAIRKLMHKHARAAQAVRDSELRNRTLWEITSDAVIIANADGSIQFANPACFDIFGYTDKELFGQNISMLQPPRLHGAQRESLTQLQNPQNAGVQWSSAETTALHKSGREIPVEASFAKMQTSLMTGYVGFFRDISRRMKDQSALRLRDRAIESSRDGIMISDALTPDHPILYINPAIQQISGYTPGEVLGGSGRIFLGKDLHQPEAETLRMLLRGGREGSVILSCFRKDGGQFWNELTVSPVRSDSGQVTHYISIFKDVTERKRQEAALIKSANFDAFTELPNRVLLLDRLGQAIAGGAIHGRKVGLLYVDLDNFKVINDSLGHDMGNRLIKTVANRLLTCLRDGDTLARVGGDEFVFLLDEIESEKTIIRVAQKILEILTLPLELDAREVVISASIGASVYPRDSTNATDLLQHADLAMHRAKEHGKNNFQFYTEEMHSRVTHRLTIETQLRKAIEREEFVLYFQPQVNLASNQVIGAEALIRWKHPELGMMSPAQFIPIAEETGLIVPIGEWVLNSACIQAKRWKDECSHPMMVAVNLSARQFHQSNLLDVVHNALTEHGLRPEQLELEITESLVMHEPEKTTLILRQMKEMGLHISLDDFGTGYSSLAYLKNFPVDRLKIDKSFIQDVAIVRAIIQLARSFNLQTVAEGVEDEDVLHLLRHLNCDIIQGYYYSPPLPADAFMLWQARRQQPEKSQ